MALGVFMWVSLITLLLDGSAALSMKKGHYRYKPSSKNLNDLLSHDDFSSLTSDEGTLDKPTNKPADFVYTSYNKPSVPKPVNMVPIGQRQQSTPDVERIVNGELRRWEAKLFDPITFPLSGNRDAEAPKLPPTQPQSTPLNVYTISKPVSAPSHPISYTPVQPSRPMAVPAPSFQSWQPASASQIPSRQGIPQYLLGSRQLPTVSPDASSNSLIEGLSSYGSEGVKRPAATLYASSSNAEELAKQSSMNEIPQSYTPMRYGLDNRVDATRYTSVPYDSVLPGYNQVSKPESPAVYKLPSQKLPQYTSTNAKSGMFDTAKPDSQSSMGNMPSTEYTSPPRKPVSQSAAGTESSPKGWMEVPSFASIFGVGFPELNQIGDLSANSVFNMKGSLPPLYPMPPSKPLRKTFFIRTKNSYQRGRLIKSKTTYTPIYNTKTEMSISGPARAQAEQALQVGRKE